MKISEAAEKFGFRTLGIKASLKNWRMLHCIVYCIGTKNRYVVLHRIKKSVYYISDSAIGFSECNETDFLKFWIGNNVNESIKEDVTLLQEPISKF